MPPVHASDRAASPGKPGAKACAAAAWVLAAAVLAGCGSKGQNLVVEAPNNVNGGKPVYMVVRAVDGAKFAADSYKNITEKVATPDDSVVLTEVIYPGTQPSFAISEPAKGQIAVYFLFSSPSGDWRTLLDKPLPKAVSIKLSRDQIDTR